MALPISNDQLTLARGKDVANELGPGWQQSLVVTLSRLSLCINRRPTAQPVVGVGH